MPFFTRRIAEAIPAFIRGFLGNPSGYRSLLSQGLEVGVVLLPPKRSLVFRELASSYENT